MHQYLFYIGDFPILMYGLVLCMAIFLATGTAYFLAKQDGRWHEHVLDIGIYGGFAGLIGGRLWEVFFFDWDYYSEEKQICQCFFIINSPKTVHPPFAPPL